MLVTNTLIKKPNRKKGVQSYKEKQGESVKKKSTIRRCLQSEEGQRDQSVKMTRGEMAVR